MASNELFIKIATDRIDSVDTFKKANSVVSLPWRYRDSSYLPYIVRWNSSTTHCTGIWVSLLNKIITLFLLQNAPEFLNLFRMYLDNVMLIHPLSYFFILFYFLSERGLHIFLADL